MSNQLATISPLHEQLGIPEQALQLLTPVQQGWIMLSKKKTDTFDFLTRNELEIQALCLTLQRSDNLIEIQELLKQAKSKAAEAKDCRLNFTNMLNDKLIAPSMLFEKRNEELIKHGVDKELEVRKVEYTKAQEVESLNKEKAALKAHILNEWARIGTKYRNDLDKIITEGYTYALQGDFTGEVLFNHLKALQKFLVETRLDGFKKFEKKLVSNEDAQKIFAEVSKFDPQQDLNKSLSELETKFKSYDADLKNKQKAIEQANKERALKEQANQETLEIETSTNNLVAQANEYSVTGITAPTVKYKDQLVEDNTPEWALAVLSAFIANFKEAAPLLKVKTWSKLSIGQMGTALEKIHNETGKAFTNLSFTKIAK